MRTIYLVFAILIFACGAPVLTASPVPEVVEYVETSEPATVIGFDKLVVCNAPDGLNVRKEMGNEHDIVAVLQNGDKVIPLDFSDKLGRMWIKIEGGWISSRYVCPATLHPR